MQEHVLDRSGTRVVIFRFFVDQTFNISFEGNAAAIVTPELKEKLSKLALSSLIKPLLDCNHVHIVKETLWVTSNILAIDEAVASQVMSTDILQSLGRCLNYGETIQKEVKLLHLVQKYKV